MSVSKPNATKSTGAARSLAPYRIAAGVMAVLVACLLYCGLRHNPGAQAASVVAPAQAAVPDDSQRWSGWASDMRSVAGAAADGKDLLVDFASGQDQLPRLETLLLDPAFAPAVSRQFVKARFDVTTSHSDPATVERTAVWIDQLNLTDLPCLVLFDSALRPYGVIRGAEVGSTSDLLIKLRGMADAKARRDADLTAAAAATGIARARLLDRALDDVGPAAAPGYPAVMQEIVRLDPDGAAGLKGRYAARVSDRLVDDGIQHLVYPLVDAGDLRGALEQAGRLERNVATTVPQHQLLQAFQAQLYSSLGQKQKALAIMDGAIALDPSTDAASRVRNEKAKIEQ
jgi:hypothetical protein